MATSNSSSIGAKRKNFEFLDDESASLRIKRAKMVPTEDMMVLGLVPMMTITPVPVKYAPNQELVRQVKRIINARTKTQKQVAKECRLSPTKMSRFMNMSPKVKGWESVEAKVSAWLKNTSRNHRPTHLLKTDYSVPQSCVVSFVEPKKEDFTICGQNSDNDWQFKGSSTSSCLPRTDLQCASSFHTTEYPVGNYSCDEVSNTSSDQYSGVEISAEIEDLVIHHPKPNSDGCSPEYTPISASLQPNSRRSSDRCHGFYNDHAWDNFSILQVLDSPI